MDVIEIKFHHCTDWLSLQAIGHRGIKNDPYSPIAVWASSTFLSPYSGCRRFFKVYTTIVFLKPKINLKSWPQTKQWVSGDWRGGGWGSCSEHSIVENLWFFMTAWLFHAKKMKGQKFKQWISSWIIMNLLKTSGI